MNCLLLLKAVVLEDDILVISPGPYDDKLFPVVAKLELKSDMDAVSLVLVREMEGVDKRVIPSFNSCSVGESVGLLQMMLIVLVTACGEPKAALSDDKFPLLCELP